MYTQVRTYTAAPNFTPSAANPVYHDQAIPAGLTYVSAAFAGRPTHAGVALFGSRHAHVTDNSNLTTYHTTNTTTFTITMTVGAATGNGTITDSVTANPGARTPPLKSLSPPRPSPSQGR